MSLTWEECLEFGNKWQKKAIEALGLNNVRVMPGKFEEFDVVSVEDGKIIFREFKADRLASKTGNMAIEFNHKGNPSGIAKSLADFWNYVIVYEKVAVVYDIPTSVLKEFIHQNLFHDAKVCNDGSICYIFNKDVFGAFARCKIEV
jgi:hypothetical protein